MAFEKYLKKNIIGSWRVQYIQYELLKLFIKDRPQPWSIDDETDFLQLFRNECNKVNQFIKDYTSQLEGRIQHCHQLLSHPSPHFAHTIDDTLIEILFDINDFTKFIHINDVGFERILKKHKKWTGNEQQTHQMGSFEHETYYAKVSKLRYRCREPCPKVISTPELHPPQTSSKKYWIHREHLSEVIAILCIHMFLDVDTTMSNFYLDNEERSGYFDRRDRKDNIGMIKFKRYGADKLYVEQEIYSQLPSGNQQLKRRFPVSYNPDHWQGDVHFETLENQDIKHQIKTKGLKMSLQCDYHRLIFHMLNNPNIRVTLDTHISFQRPGGKEERSGVKKNLFEMGVLEIKTTTDASLPTGLQSLIHNNELVREVPGFSKYVQGIYQLSEVSAFPTWSNLLPSETQPFHLPKENAILSRSPSLRPLLEGVPYPFSAHYPFQRSNSTNNSTITTKNASAFTSLHESDSSRSRLDYKPGLSDTSFQSFDSMEKGTSRIMKKKEIKVEPKVFFANERTFISWLQFCALLLTVALNLLNFGDKTSKISGAIFLLIAMLLSIYALVRFQHRARMLRQQRQGRYDDTYGPVVLCILIVGALVINFWLRFK